MTGSALSAQDFHEIEAQIVGQKIRIMEALTKTLLIYFLLGNSFLNAQSPFESKKDLFTAPKHYVANYASTQIIIDGEIDDEEWNGAEWSESFTDIEGSKRIPPQYKTKVKMLWRDSSLFVGAELEEPEVWGTLKFRDEIIYHDNDFEVFIDPDGNTPEYYEIEVNTLNTILDLHMPKPYRINGRADLNWNVAGLKSATKIDGTLNDPSDVDKGWTVEMEIPFKALRKNESPCFPKDGAVWRINFSRVEWDVLKQDGKYQKKKALNGKFLPEHNWVWSPQGLIDMHFPERWGYLIFKKDKSDDFVFDLSYREKQKKFLWLVYYKQMDYLKEKNQFARSVKELGLATNYELEGQKNYINIISRSNGFLATVESEDGSEWTIDEEGLIQQVKPTP
jgi:hypothetical protein